MRAAEQQSKADQEQEQDRVNLQGEIPASLNEATGQRQPDEKDEMPAGVDSTRSEPAQPDGEKAERDQGAAGPTKSNAGLQPVVMKLGGPISVRRNAVKLKHPFEGARAGPENRITTRDGPASLIDFLTPIKGSLQT